MFHQMDYIGSSGNIDEYWCPICGRQLGIQSVPTVRKIVRIIGDDTAQHRGSKPLEPNDNDNIPPDIKKTWEDLLQDVSINL